MGIGQGYLFLAHKLEEALSSLSHKDVKDRLSGAIKSAHKGTGKSGSYVDHTGDGTSGDAIYSVSDDNKWDDPGEMHSAPYTADKTSASVDTTKAKKVVPSVTYRPVAEPKESGPRAGAQIGDMKLVESAGMVDTIKLAEVAKTDYEVKLIAPGKGSTAFYPAEVLKRDGPKVFKAGTHMYWNHATDAEEAARPEGNLDHLAAVLTKDAYWVESGKQGPGLYSRAKVFSDYATKVEEKAPHIGLSIRAAGNAVKGKFTEGRPELAELTYADSTDFVTKAGAGGMVLTEAFAPATITDDRKQYIEAARAARAASAETQILERGGADDMDAAVLQRLQVAEALVRKLTERASVADAAVVIAEYFTTVRVGEAIQQRVTRRVLAGPLPSLTASGELDRAAITKLAEAETKDEVTYIASLTGRPVTGMGMIQEAALTDAQKAEQAKATERELTESAHLFGVRGKMGTKIWSEGRASFDPNYNSGEKEAAA